MHQPPKDNQRKQNPAALEKPDVVEVSPAPVAERVQHLEPPRTEVSEKEREVDETVKRNAGRELCIDIVNVVSPKSSPSGHFFPVQGQRRVNRFRHDQHFVAHGSSYLFASASHKS